MKLGRLKRPPGARFLKLADHLAAPLPPAPASWDGLPGSVLDMYGNDQHGDCVVAGIANLSSVQAAAEGNSGLHFDPQAVVDLYFRMSGGSDSGLVEVDTLQTVGKDGFLGVKIPHFAGIDHTDVAGACAAAYLFTGLFLGVDLPDDWEAGVHNGIWELTGPANPDNGHAVAVVGFDTLGPVLATWGQTIPATWEWFLAYCVESYVLLDANRAGVDVLNGKGLIDAAAALASETGIGR